MRYKTICTIHPNRFIVAIPKRQNKRGFVCSWKVLNVQHRFEKAEELQDYYKNEGLSEVVILDTGNSEDNSLPPNKVAEFYRVFFGME